MLMHVFIYNFMYMYMLHTRTGSNIMYIHVYTFMIDYYETLISAETLWMQI